MKDTSLSLGTPNEAEATGQSKALSQAPPGGVPDAPLAGRKPGQANTLVKVRDCVFGGPAIVLMAGPCAVENRDSLRRSAEAAASGGARLLRGGAFKPRTSPYSFQGLGEAGLEMLRDVAGEFGLGVVTEVMTPTQVAEVAVYSDLLQIGTRSMQNFPLLKEVGEAKKPVLLKRGLMSTLDEWLLAAEYVMHHGNPDVILCERGIRTFEPRMRNTFDIMAIPLMKQLTHLPVIGDPSHATGHSSLVAAAARAAVAAGADGLLLEVHPDPARALSDGQQALTPDAFTALSAELRTIASTLGRSV